MNVSDEGRAPERFNGTYISANAFRLLGQAPILGRDFLPEDDEPGAAGRHPARAAASGRTATAATRTWSDGRCE